MDAAPVALRGGRCDPSRRPAGARPEVARGGRPRPRAPRVPCARGDHALRLGAARGVSARHARPPPCPHRRAEPGPRGRVDPGRVCAPLPRAARRRGPLFRPRFWSRRIRDERGLLRAALYVDLNPVAAGIVSHPARYRWGSYGRPRPWLVGLLGADDAVATATYAEIVDASCRRLLTARLPDVVDSEVTATLPFVSAG